MDLGPPSILAYFKYRISKERKQLEPILPKSFSMKRNQKGDVWQQSRTVARKEMESKRIIFHKGGAMACLLMGMIL